MSRFVKVAAGRTRAKTPAARLVIVMLADGAGKEDLLTWPKQRTLARLCGITDRGVRKALRELEALGEIRVVTHGQGRGSTVYRIDILDPAFDVIEPEPNRNPGSYLKGEETGTPFPLSECSKPEQRDRETGTPVPIEEIEEIISQRSSVFPSGADRNRAVKGQPVFLPSSKKISDLANGAVADRLGDYSREAAPRQIVEVRRIIPHTADRLGWAEEARG